MSNQVSLHGDVAHIHLTNGRVAVIDAEDVSKAAPFHWFAGRRLSYQYAVAMVDMPNGKKTSVYLHRLVTAAPRGKVVDHINHDTLDNRRANLRVGSHKENHANGRWALTTHCPKGHAYDAANTHVNKKGKRICRECARLRAAAIIAAETPEQRERRRERVATYYCTKSGTISVIARVYQATRKAAKADYDRARRQRLAATL